MIEPRDQALDDDLCLGLEEPCTAGGGERCDACRLYAKSLDHFALERSSPADNRPLPAALGARLRAMTEDFADADPLYVRALAGEPLGGHVPPGEVENPGRRAAHDALAVTFAEARRRRPLPPSLAAKLRAIPRRSTAARLPIWLADSRWATAASLVLTAALALAAGDVSARFQAISDPAPIVERLERAELEALLATTDERLAQAGETASKQARGRVEQFAAWRRAQGEAAEKTWTRIHDATTEKIDLAVRALEETKIGQLVGDLLQQGENDE